MHANPETKFREAKIPVNYFKKEETSAGCTWCELSQPAHTTSLFFHGNDKVAPCHLPFFWCVLAECFMQLLFIMHKFRPCYSLFKDVARTISPKAPTVSVVERKNAAGNSRGKAASEVFLTRGGFLIFPLSEGQGSFIIRIVFVLPILLVLEASSYMAHSFHTWTFFCAAANMTTCNM